MRTRYFTAVILAIALITFPSLINQGYAASGNSVNQVQTVTVGTTLMTSQSQRQQIFGGAFKVISTTGTNLRCQLYNFSFTADQGQYISGNFTSVVPLDFYIIPGPVYHNWVRAGSCGEATDAISSQMATMAYGFDVTFTSTGPWDIVLVNSSNRDADGFLVAYLSSASYTITEPLLATTTLASVTSASLPTGIPGFPVESILVGALIGVAILLVLRQKKRIR